YLAESGYTWQDWKTRDPAEVIPDLLGIKGVGPYTANLAVNLSYGRGGTAHVDTYVTNVIGTLYLNNPNASPEQVAQFIDHRWGTHGEAVLDLLTTDTEVWTTELGVTMGVRSGCPRLTYCDRRGIAFVPYGPLAAGTLVRPEEAPGDT